MDFAHRSTYAIFAATDQSPAADHATWGNPAHSAAISAKPANLAFGVVMGFLPVEDAPALYP